MKILHSQSELDRDAKKLKIDVLDLLATLVNNLFIKTPLEADQDLEEIQFGFKVEMIGGMQIEELKNNQNGENSAGDNMETDGEQKSDEGKDDKDKKDKKKNEDSGEGKLLEKNQKEIRDILENKQNVFTPSEGRMYVVSVFVKRFDEFLALFEKFSLSEASPKALKAHRRNISLGISGTRTLISTKYKNSALDRIIVAKLLSLFNLLLELSSEDFITKILDSQILKYIIDL